MEQRFHQKHLYGETLNYSYVKEGISAVQL